MTDWLDDHLETFVRPLLGCVPNVEPNNQWVQIFNPQALDNLKRLWRAARVKAGENTPIFLPGRDVFNFEILARIEGNHQTIFRPEISAPVSKSALVKEDYSETFGVDSGYSGSVFKALGVKKWGLVAGQNLLMPVIVGGLCGSLESCPKYWTRGEVKNGKIKQEIVKTRALIYDAAILTRHIGAWFQRELRKEGK